MAIADVASRLYSSSAYRNTPVIKALADSVKMNLKFRFSLVGMAAALTGSQTLYQIAQQKYLITDEEKKQAKEEIHFKKYVVSSISTLSKQVALIESIVEKNSMMISAIASDLGYFKGQRRIATNSYSSLKSFRAPISSRTVKGRIDLINTEIAALKGIRVAQQTAKQKEAAKEISKKEKDKQRGLIAGVASATLAALGLGAAGAGAGIAALGAGAAGIAGSAIASQIGKQLVANALPVIGKAFKISVGFGLMMSAQERMSRRSKGLSGVQTGELSDYTNTIDPKTDPIGYKIRQNEIELRKSIDALFEEFSKPIDASIAAITSFLAIKYSGEFLNYYEKNKKGLKIPSKIKNLFPSLVGATSAVAATSTAVSGGMAAGAAVGAAAVGGRVWTGKMWKTIPSTPAGRSLTQAPKSTKIRRFLPTRFSKFMKGMSGIKGIAKFLKGPGALSAAGTVFYMANLFQATSAYESGNMSPKEFEESFVSNVSGLLSTGAAAAIGGALGAVVGGPVGLLLGSSAGLVVGFLGSGTTDEMATKLFGLLYDGEIPVTDSVDMSALPPPSTGPLSVRNNNPGNLRYVGQSGAVGADPRGFAIFPTAEAGMEAMRNQIILDTQTRGMTLTQFIQKYAPPNENDTRRYIDYVKKQTGLNPNDRVPLESVPALQAAMIAMEGGSAATSYFASGGAGGNVIAPTSTSAMMAGTGLASTLDAQLFQFFGKEFAKVDSVRTEQQTAQDMGARAKIDMVEKAVEISREKSKAELAAMAAETQKMIDMKNLEATNYVDDKAFDEEFAGLYKVA